MIHVFDIFMVKPSATIQSCTCLVHSANKHCPTFDIPYPTTCENHIPIATHGNEGVTIWLHVPFNIIEDKILIMTEKILETILETEKGNISMATLKFQIISMGKM
jgi:hypothetical protein